MRVILLLAVMYSAVEITLADEVLNDPAHIERPVDMPVFLDGKRLFFDVHERASLKLTVSDMQSDMPSEKYQGGEQAVSDGVVVPETSQEKRQRASKYIALRYDARVESEGYLRIIINGIPCDRIERLTHLSEKMDRPLACAQSKKIDLQLLLLADGRRVQVVRNETIVDVLAPGQTL